MGTAADIFKRAGSFAAEVVAETLWPTRCVLCDALGSVLCVRCAEALPHIDWWKACHRCGSAFGRIQCDRCNPVMLEREGREEWPFSGAASAVDFTVDTGQIVRAYKDQGERRLASVMAGFMARMVAPAWRFEEVTFVPATKAALRHRGFDHAELIAHEVAMLLDKPCSGILERPVALDQRGLAGRERIANLSNRFRARPDATPGSGVLLVDDVLTTGATLAAASDALLAAGACDVYCLTFACV